MSWQLDAPSQSAGTALPVLAQTTFDLTEEETDELEALLHAPATARGKLIGVPKAIPMAAPDFLFARDAIRVAARGAGDRI
jgi:hypothetical protein